MCPIVSSTSSWDNRRLGWRLAFALCALPLLSNAQSDLPGTEGAGTDPSLAQAAQAQLDLKMAPTKRGIGLSMSADASHAWKTDTDDDGAVSASRQTLDVGYLLKVPFPGALGFSLKREWSQYRFDGPADSALANALRHASITDLGINYRRALSDDWGLFGALTLSSSTARDADWDDGLHGSGLLVFRWQRKKNVAHSLGIIAATRGEDRPLIFPIPGIDWQITDRLSLITAQGVTLAYKLDGTRRWIVDLAGSYGARGYRLPDKGELANRYVRDRSIPILLGLNYAPNPGLLVRVYGGAIVWQKFEVRHDGEEESTTHSDPTPMAGLYARLRL